jgi:ATP-dependent RNA helicase DDX3X
VTGGLGARGWDVAGVTHVINYDLPTVGKGGIDEYVHRIGRTARMGNTGLATSLYTSHDEGLAQDLVNHLVENECEVPEFLSHLTPQEAPDFGDESEDEDAAENSGDPHSGDGAAENGGEHHDSHQGGEDEVNKVAGKLAMVDFKPEGFTPEPSATAASAW